MLARSFMSAADLKISSEQRDALIKTLNLFERGEVKHLNETTRGDCFSMNYWSQECEFVCGTICCIAGWAEKIVGKSLFRVSEDDRFDFNLQRPRALHCLFFPNDDEDIAIDVHYYHSITVEQAARAISNYLTTGRPQWVEVLNI
jgi:hypothetical protein